MIPCPECNGTRYRTRDVDDRELFPRNYRTPCTACEDGVAICICGDYATRVNDEGVPQCDREFFAWEREEAA